MSNAITQAKKNVFNARRKRLLSTTAIVAAGMMLASPALADNWGDHQYDVGDVDVDVSTPNVTNLNQNTDFVKARGDGDITENHTVNIFQPGSGSKYVLFDIESDPTLIQGKLNANGQVYIFDSNGVVFGENSVVDVGAIVTSTGFVSDENIQAGNLVFENVGTDGAIEIRGTVSVADSGLAAFVAPTVANSGIINAKMGTVVMAAGETVTLDMYGDGLVEVAVEGELGNALLESTGEINAEGGTVIMAASDAKEVVDNLINVDGIVDVSSVSQQGGKIILSGGNINVAKDAQLKANNGGKVIAVADGKMQLDGKISATGGFVETSGTEVGMGAGALVTASQWLIDPLSILISNSVNPDFTNISAAALAASLSAGTNTTIITGFNSTVTGGPTDDNAGNIVVADEINVNSATDVTLSLQAYNNILVVADIKATGPAGLNLELIGEAFGPLAGEQIVAVASDIDTNGGYFLGTADRFIMGDVFGAGSSIDTTGVIDNFALVIADDYDIAGTINAGTSAVKFTRLTDGAMSLGDFVSGAHLTQAELEQIDAGTLIIGGEHVNEINVGNVNTTTATISGLVDLTTSVNTGDTDDVNFAGTNVFNALRVNSNDDIVFADNASVETLIGDATFIGDTNTGTVGNFDMGQGSVLDTNGNNVVVSVLNLNMGQNSTIASEGGNINIEARNDFAGDGDVTLQSGALIDADGGNIVINNKDIFSSVDADSVRTHSGGTIDINQNNGGSIQNAIDAVDNGGAGLNTIHVGAGTYNENILVYEDNFLLEGANHGIDPNTGVRGAESLIDGGLGGPDGERFGFKVTSSNVTIDGFQITGDGNGVFLDGGDDDTATSKFDIKNNIITTINDADGDDEGVRGFNVGDVIVRNNHLTTIGNHGMQFTKVNNVFILDNAIDGVIDEDGIHFDSPLNKGSVVIRDNTIVAPGDDGIDLDGVSGTATVEISGNTILNATDDGIDIGSVTSNGTVVLADSASNVQSVSGNSDGVEIRNLQSSNGVSIYGGSYAGNEHGLLVDNTTQTSTKTGRLVLNNVTPLTFYGLLPTSTAFSALTNAEGPALDIDMQGSTALFVGGEVGMHLSGVGIDILGDTIGATEYVNNSNFFIQLADGAEFQPGTPTLLDGSNATFYDATINGLVGPGGISGIDASAGGYSFAEINALANVETKVFHYLDGEDLGLFSLIPHGFVGDSSFGLQGIQRMINVASSGDTLLLGSGVYNDPSDTDAGYLPLEVYKSLTILGANHETVAAGGGRTAGSADEVVLDFAGATGAAGVTVSPAILIYADNVTLKGVDLSTDSSNIAGIRLLDLDAGGSLDNIDISNNFIHGGLATPIIGHGITTTNDLLSQGYTNINISGNDIFNATGDGAHIDGATGLAVSGNLIHDVGQNGVVVNNSIFATVVGNTIGNTGLDGIEATNSSGIVIVSNEIGTLGGANNIGAEGIDVNGSDGALIAANTIVNTVSNGISVNPSSNVLILSNTIDNTGADGVLVTGGTNNAVLSNQIGTFGGANNIGDDGVHISGSDNATVDGNIIQNTVNNGVHVNPSNDVTVSNNNISFAGKNGVLVESGSGVDIFGNAIFTTGENGVRIDNHNGAYVYLNQIVQTLIDGIQINGSDNAVVDTNTIDNVADDGIDINNSDNASVKGNLIGTNNVDGSIGDDGVTVGNGSDTANVEGNTIRADGRGVSVFGGNDHVVHANTIRTYSYIDGEDEGIFADNTVSIDITDNDIFTADNAGIRVNVGSDAKVTGNDIDSATQQGIDIQSVTTALVDNNDVDNTGSHGINAFNTSGLTISNNRVGTTGAANNINGDGIRVELSGGALIKDNIVDETIGNGIYVLDSDNAIIGGADGDGNTVTDADLNGIYVSSSDGTTISWNGVSRTGGNGILVNPSNNVTVSNNTISDVLENGIKIESGSWIDVLSNNISFAALNGIHVDGSNNVRIKDNTIFDVGIDGIHANNIGGNGLYDGSALIIKGNEIDYAGDDGIEVLDSGKTLIKNNNIAYVGYDSYYYDGYFGTVLNNGDGIHVNNVFGFDGDHDIKIVDNTIHQTGDDGIDVGNSGRTLISGNNISDAGVGGESEEGPYYGYGYGDEHGADGIFVHNSGNGLIEMAALDSLEGPGYYGEGYHGYSVNIIDNNINATGDDGIEVINSGSTYVANNNIINTGVSEGGYYGYEGEGYYGYYGNDGGDLFGHGADGIHVRNVYGFGPIFSGYEGEYYDVAIVGNNTNNTSDDGIEVVDSGRTLIRENKVKNTGLIGHQNVQDGFGYGDGYRSLYFSGGDYYGADGIHVRDSGENRIAFAEIQSLEGPGYYDGYGYHGYDINIIDNKVNTTGDDGIEVVDSGSTLIDNNRIKNVGVTKVQEVYYGGYGYEGEGYYGYGETSYRTGADQYGADAVHVRGVHNNDGYGEGYYDGYYGYQPYAVVVSNNDIENVSDDGIEVLDSGRTRIEYNDIEDVGLKGYKYITQGYGEYENLFKMKFSGGDYYGADGIHVRNVFDNNYYPYYDYGYGFGNAVEIVGNDIEDTGDDGIEVVRSGRTLIDSNEIFDVGVNALDNGYGYGYEAYGKGEESHDGFGADGIHVREVLGQVYIYGDYAGIALPGMGVEIVDNHIDNTADDGIQVLWSGNTLIHNNTILNAGNVVEEYLDEVEYYGGYGYYGSYELLTKLQDNHGADGIHVHTGFFKNGLPGGESEYEYEGYSEPYFLSTHVEITENTIGSIDGETGETSEGPSDDGIETEGVTSLLIADNNVYDAGDDGIKVIGYAGFFANEVELPEEEVILFGGGYYGAPEFDVVIEGNTVIDSGSPADEVSEEVFESESYEGYGRRTYGVDYDGQSHGDGIEITGYDRADVFDNVVTNSMENGLYVSGPFNARFDTNVLEELDEDARRIKVAGNIFTNNRIGANFESGLIDMTGTPNQFIGGDHSEIGLLFKPFDFASLESDDYHYGDYGYYGDYGFQKVTPRDFGAWQGWPIYTYVPTEGYADLALLDVDGAGSTPFDPEVIPTNFGGTIGSQIFRGFQESGDFFVALDNFAFFDQESGLPIWQNALNSTFETPFGDVTPITTGGILSQNVFDFLEEKFFHFPDRGDIGIFFFGFVPTDIDQARIFDEFDPFAAGISGLNVTITGLPPLNLGPQALANIAPAAGGEGEGAADLASIEPAAGGEDTGCMGDVVFKASNGTPASINWGGTTEELLSDTAGCGSETF